MIIDMHTHLGDILYPGGGKLIDRKGVKKRIFFDIISQSERMYHRGTPGLLYEWIHQYFFAPATRASRARNATATLENMRRAMDGASVDKTVCMPIPPHVTFSDLQKRTNEDASVFAFTGIDYTQSFDPDPAFKNDVSNGAKGLKLHPIIQQTALNSEKTFQTVEAFSVHKLPVLFHCGMSSYYLGTESQTKEKRELGTIAHARDLVAAFPRVRFIAGHAGLFEYRTVIDLLGKYNNVMVDTSFQPPGHVRELIAAFGPERVLYASDWPYGNMMPAIKIIKKACKKDTAIQKLIFHENAAALLNLS